MSISVRKITLFAGGTLLVAILIGFSLTRIPLPPLFKGIPLSDWLRNTGRPSYSDAEALEVLRSLDVAAVPWLVWAAEHGHRPDNASSEAASSLSLMDWLRGWWSGGTRKEYDFYDERERALWALRQIGRNNNQVADLMRRMIADPQLGLSAAEFLAKQGGEERILVFKLSQEGSGIVRRNAVKALSELHDSLPETERSVFREQLLLVISRALRDSDPMVRAAAAIAYGNVPNSPEKAATYREVLPTLIELLSDDTWQVRDGAGWALYTMEEDASDATPKAMDLLSDTQPFVRRRIARALGKIDKMAKRSGEALRQMAENDSDMSCRVAAAAALGNFGVPADSLVRQLISQLDSPEATERGKALCYLLDIGPNAASAMPAILKAMEKPVGYPANYGIIISEFYKFGVPACVPYVVHALKHPDPVVRQYAAILFESRLWDQKNPEVEKALSEASLDPEEKVRAAAQKALERLRERR